MQFNRFNLRQTVVAAALVFAAHSALAVDPFTVRDIRVEGLQRVEPGTIFASIPVRVGDTYNDEKGTASIRALFGLGLFKDIRLDVSGDVLIRVHTQHGERLPSSISIWHAFVSHAERGKKVLDGRCVSCVCVSCAVWWGQCRGRELHGEPHCDLGEGRTDWKSSLVG